MGGSGANLRDKRVRTPPEPPVMCGASFDHRGFSKNVAPRYPKPKVPQNAPFFWLKPFWLKRTSDAKTQMEIEDTY